MGLGVMLSECGGQRWGWQDCGGAPVAVMPVSFIQVNVLWFSLGFMVPVAVVLVFGYGAPPGADSKQKPSQVHVAVVLLTAVHCRRMRAPCSAAWPQPSLQGRT